ncbi:hypothetical protein GA0070624_2047 [Micromonospora rhizosphaerae]|uniref:YcxB-like protein n=1 Tax=Micromonospora rhizosphaerae TaxID=568872 RepID=A0A1C6RTS6_9ACTN|nr:YcxB family protein [Micromonospora rhizosphaerae]SCL20605.1 hypothetical protein GA0070624_2047 [Micromonospora rhizosphaerae]
MSADATAQPVLLEFTLTADDLLDGLTAAHRVIRRPWYLRWLAPLLTLGIVLVVALKSALSGDLTPTVGVALAILAMFMLLFSVGLTLLFRRRLNPARLTYRWSSRQLIQGNPMLARPLRVSVGEAGVHIAGATGETRTAWSQYPYHLETARSFALLASDRLGAAVLVLPKRAMGETDAAGLRALLAAHTRRLGDR